MSSRRQKSQTRIEFRRELAADLLWWIAWALLVGALVSWTYYWDPTRIVFKTVMADSPYRYKQIDPEIAAVDPSAHLTIRPRESLAARRGMLARSLWGEKGLPLDRRPRRAAGDALKELQAQNCPTGRPQVEIHMTLACAKERYKDAPGLERIEAWAVDMEKDYRALYAVFRPKQDNGRLVVYHHGFAGTYHDYYPYILRLVRAGYTVIAHNLAGYGDNRFAGSKPEGAGNDAERESALPYHVYFTPVIASLNQALEDGAYSSTAMIGFSAGGWVTAVAAALDTRIDRSYVVAGALPVYMRGVRERADIFLHPKLLNAATYLDLFLLGAGGQGRAQIQIFNRYDRCCYQNTRGKLYEGLVRKRLAQRGGGHFDVWIDETHARHKLSAEAFRRILTDLSAYPSQGARP